MIHTAIYRCWRHMKARCTNPNDQKYARYGGRGIVVCDEWLKDFRNFYVDMGERPYDLYSLDRIDNDKGYYKENCRWATRKQQSNNRNDSLNNANSRKTHCPKGHEYTHENTYYSPNGARSCATCKKKSRLEALS